MNGSDEVKVFFHDHPGWVSTQPQLVGSEPLVLEKMPNGNYNRQIRVQLKLAINDIITLIKTDKSWLTIAGPTPMFLMQGRTRSLSNVQMIGTQNVLSIWLKEN